MALKRLDWNSDYKVAKGDPDIRGWSVADSSGNEFGKVDGLLFEPESREVRYGIVKTRDRDVLLPIGSLDVNESRKVITTRGYDQSRISGLSAFTGDSFDETTERSHYKQHNTGWNETAAVDYKTEHFRGNVPQTIRLIEERLRIGKREEQIGEVVATKRPVTETVEETVQLRKETIDIQRTPVNEPLRAGDRIGNEAETIRVPLYAEEAVIEKTPFVKEEVTINKKSEVTTERIRETVRSEELAFAGTEPTEEEMRRPTVDEQVSRRPVSGTQDVDIIPDDRL